MVHSSMCSLHWNLNLFQVHLGHLGTSGRCPWSTCISWQNFMAKVHCADFASEMLLGHWEEIDATLCHTQGQEFQFSPGDTVIMINPVFGLMKPWLLARRFTADVLQKPCWFPAFQSIDRYRLHCPTAETCTMSTFVASLKPPNTGDFQVKLRFCVGVVRLHQLIRQYTLPNHSWCHSASVAHTQEKHVATTVQILHVLSFSLKLGQNRASSIKQHSWKWIGWFRETSAENHDYLIFINAFVPYFPIIQFKAPRFDDCAKQRKS